MRNYLKDLVDVAKYKRERNTAINEFETIRDKYIELLEDRVEQYSSMKRQIFDINKRLKKVTERVSNLEDKKKR